MMKENFLTSLKLTEEQEDSQYLRNCLNDLWWFDLLNYFKNLSTSNF